MTLQEGIVKVLTKLKPDNEVTEMRVLKTNSGTVSGYYDKYEFLIEDALAWNDYNVYMTINPVKRDLIARKCNDYQRYATHTTKDDEIEKYSTLMIDCDPRRPAGISATQEEHEQAIKLAEKIKMYLESLGWSKGILVDSGNGAHLLYKIDLPNDSESVELVKNVLKVLDSKFSNDDVEVDKTTYNPARICKIPYTMSHKGEDMEDRPHRRSKVLKMPKVLKTIPKEKMKELVNEMQIQKHTKTSHAPVNESVDEVVKLLDKYHIEYTIKEDSDKYTFVLDVCPWREEHTDRSAYIVVSDKGIFAKCHHNSCNGESWYSLLKKLGEPIPKKSERVVYDDEFLKKSPSFILTTLIQQDIPFVDDMGNCWVTYEKQGIKHTVQAQSDNYKSRLGTLYKQVSNNIATSELKKVAIEHLKDRAIEAGMICEPYLRCGYDEEQDVYLYDLNTKDNKVVVIKENQWTLEKNQNTVFKRFNTMKQQIEPVQGIDNLDALDKYINLRSEGEKLLLKVVLVTAFIPNIPRPLNIFYGEKGASKTTVVKMLNAIVDPNKKEVMTFPKKDEDLILAMYNTYMPSFDNLDSISNEKSNLLCSAVTGASMTKRKLYSDTDETCISIKRPINLNGINIAGTNADLLDRAVLFQLERIPEELRITEQELWKIFREDLPTILGGCFTILSKAMVHMKTVRLPRLKRMADFTKWGYCIAEAMGVGGETFLNAYDENGKNATDEVVDSNVVAKSILTFMKDKQKWVGSTSDLYEQIKATGKYADDPNFPKGNNIFGKRINELKSNIEEKGIRITKTKVQQYKQITLEKIS